MSLEQAVSAKLNDFVKSIDGVIDWKAERLSLKATINDCKFTYPLRQVKTNRADCLKEIMLFLNGLGINDDTEDQDIEFTYNISSPAIHRSPRDRSPMIASAASIADDTLESDDIPQPKPIPYQTTDEQQKRIRFFSGPLNSSRPSHTHFTSAAALTKEQKTTTSDDEESEEIAPLIPVDALPKPEPKLKPKLIRRSNFYGTLPAEFTLPTIDSDKPLPPPPPNL